MLEVVFAEVARFGEDALPAADCGVEREGFRGRGEGVAVCVEVDSFKVFLVVDKVVAQYVNVVLLSGDGVGAVVGENWC